MTSGIYLITNTVTGDTYVGRSEGIESRWESHIAQLRSGRHYKKMQSLCNSTGIQAFSFSILEICNDKEKLPFLENKWFHQLKPSLNTASTYPIDPSAGHTGLRFLRLKSGLTTRDVQRLTGIYSGHLIAWESTGFPAVKRPDSKEKYSQIKEKLASLYGCTCEDVEAASEEIKQLCAKRKAEKMLAEAS